MRRMLDPKEVGGGSLYCHQIEFIETPNNIITINYFTNSDVPFTRSSLETRIDNHHLACSGAISSTTSGTKVKYIAAYLYINNKKTISCYAINVENGDYKYVSLDTYNLHDDVVPA